MNDDLTAKANVTIHAPIAKVWDALVNPQVIKRYMFGATAVSDWKEGSPIAWKGEWKGKPFEDKGRILELRPQERLRYSHFSPLSGAPDKPENYHQVTIDLSELGDEQGQQEGQVRLDLSQDNNKTKEARDESQRNWATMLEGVKKVVEQS
jgi:uncharacterized protein YndB with AHSA1/START domain